MLTHKVYVFVQTLKTCTCHLLGNDNDWSRSLTMSVLKALSIELTKVKEINLNEIIYSILKKHDSRFTLERILHCCYSSEKRNYINLS